MARILAALVAAVLLAARFGLLAFVIATAANAPAARAALQQAHAETR